MSSAPVPSQLPESLPANAALDALLLECESAAGGLLVSAPALAALTTDLAARNEDARKLAQADLARARAVLIATRAHVLRNATQAQRKRSKQRGAVANALKVSIEQLRACAAAVCDGVLASLDGTLIAASPLLSLTLVQPPTHAVAVVALCTDANLRMVNKLGNVATGDGLRVLNAAGPGLKWFDPEAPNEFCVVLGLAVGSVPAWLLPDDVTLVPDTACMSVGTVSSVVSVLGGSATVRYTVSVSVTLREPDSATPAPEPLTLALSLTVCGVPISSAGDNSGVWCAAVRRKAVSDHQCAARGSFVRAVDVVGSTKHAMAVSADEKWLVVGLFSEGRLSVHSLPDGELVRSFGSPAMWKEGPRRAETFSGRSAARSDAAKGEGPLHFDDLSRMCFAPNGNLVVVDSQNKRLHEVTLEGVFIRFVGLGEFKAGTGIPFCVAVHNDVIAVGCAYGTGPRVVLFDFGTGAVMSRFGEVGTAPGQLSSRCTGIRFIPDGSHVVVAEGEGKRLSLFTAAGVFVKCVAEGVLGWGYNDVSLSLTGEYVVADYFNHRVRIFSPDGSELRSWKAAYPTALAVSGFHLYLLEGEGDSVRVYV